MMLRRAGSVQSITQCYFSKSQPYNIKLPCQCILFPSRFYYQMFCTHKTQTHPRLQRQCTPLEISPLQVASRYVATSGTRMNTEGNHGSSSNSDNISDHTNSNDEGNASNGSYDPWQVLGVKPGVSSHMLRIRYHELMKQVHPELCENGVGDLRRLAEINKAYELVSRSPTLDKRYRNLITDQQYFYYRYLPEWMAKNIDEMPRYYSWMRWRFSAAFNIFVLGMMCYLIGAFITKLPTMTTIFLLSVACDILLHTMVAPLVGIVILMYGIVYYRSRNLSWLTSPKSFLMRELSY